MTYFEYTIIIALLLIFPIYRLYAWYVKKNYNHYSGPQSMEELPSRLFDKVKEDE